MECYLLNERFCTPMSLVTEPKPAEFPDTRWSLIDRLRSGDALCRRDAMASLCASYWPAVYTFIRRLGNPPEQSLDYAQAFFSQVVLRSKLFQEAAPAKGRLRSLTRVAVKRFVTSEYRKEAVRQKMFPGISAEAIEREEARIRSSASSTPENDYDRRWAIAVLDEAMNRAERQFIRRKPKHWRAFDLRIVRPSVWRTGEPPYSEVASTCGFRSASEAVEAVRVVRKRVLTLIAAIVAESVEDPHDQDQEFAAVLAAIRL